MIQLSVIIVDALELKTIGELHTFVKPTEESSITKHCSDRTSILTENCFGKTPAEGAKIPTFKHALNLLHDFLLKAGVMNEEFIFVSQSDLEATRLFDEACFK